MATLRLGSRRVLALPHHLGSRRTFFTSNKSAAPRSPILTGVYRTVFVLSAGLFAVYYFDARSALHRYIITPVLRYALDPETGHKVAVKVLRSGLGPRDPISDDERLKFNVRAAIFLPLHWLIDPLALGANNSQSYWFSCWV